MVRDELHREILSSQPPVRDELHQESLNYHPPVRDELHQEILNYQPPVRGELHQEILNSQLPVRGELHQEILNYQAAGLGKVHREIPRLPQPLRESLCQASFRLPMEADQPHPAISEGRRIQLIQQEFLPSAPCLPVRLEIMGAAEQEAIAEVTMDHLRHPLRVVTNQPVPGFRQSQAEANEETLRNPY
jgi:hypothetical protein